MKEVTIVGAGLVGSLWAVYMAKAGHKVRIYERRPDIRKAEITAGKSINLALSDRGWNALKEVGLEDEVRKIAIPMYGRIMHDLEGNLTEQAYGKEGQAIFSVSRGDLNSKMMSMAENAGDAIIYYNRKCYDVDLDEGICSFENTETGEKEHVRSDLIFATDGAFSAVRYNAFQKRDRFNFSQKYIEDGYRELLLPPNEDGSYKLDKNALHIWPRGRYMLIALANNDGSFTCTLFMPYKDHENSFENLKTKDDVRNFFKTKFPDFYEMMPNVAESWGDHPLSSLAITRCFPWTYGKAVLMGDAAHATVPFYGQGMNAGFEDCFKMWQLFQQYGDDWNQIFETYSKTRKPDGDALQDLSLHNYYVMRDYVADPSFLLQKKIEARIFEEYPDKWMPLYSQVTFSDIPYSKALKVGTKQDQIMKEVLTIENIESKWDTKEIDQLILSKL